MRNTVFIEKILLPAVLLLAGCLSRGGSDELTLADIQSRVRERMLKFQISETLNAVASERYEPVLAARAAALEGGYREGRWNAGDDPALQVLEDALAYALVVLSPRPAETAEKLTARKLDFAVALRVSRLGKEKDGGAAAELSMMTDWPVETVKRRAAVPLPPAETGFYPVHPESERLLDRYGHAAAFRVAADLYRTPSPGAARRAEQLRKAILNRYLMQTKNPGAEGGPELSAARLRGKLFDGVIEGL